MATFAAPDRIHKSLTRLAAASCLATLALPAAAADAQPPASIETIVQFHTVCSSCHEGQCSGRLSFDSGPAAARAHIERYLGTTNDEQATALFAMLRQVKETCGHYPVAPIRPATGTWEAAELAPWRNAQAGAYFIPLGTLAAGPRQLLLEFDGTAEGNARIDNDRTETVVDERLCADATKTIGFEASANAIYFLHLKAGTGILHRITFR
ncbi:MAG: hypothetical protein NTW45_04500 [Rhodocyclales bacterium]|nr:hypothetical protein [Rhodocyclales bacterium]